MMDSFLALNDEILEIRSIIFNDNELSIKTEKNYMLNIDLKFDITALIDDVRENMSAFQKVQVYRDGVQYNIVQRDILYVEANHSSTLIFTATNEFRSELPLSVWKDALDGKAFFQCHKSFIVNMGKIESIQGNTIFMVGGDKVSVSRRLHNEFMSAYMKYDTKWR